MHATPFTPTGDEIRWSEMHPGTGGSDRVELAPSRVFLHGLGWTSAAVFAHIVAQPALAGHRSLLIDLPGHGLSDRPARFGYTLDDHAAAVAALLDAERLRGRRVGHSMGGSIGIVLAARRPDLVARLVVAEANLDPLPPSPTGLGSQQISSIYTEAAWVSAAFEEFVAANPEWAPTLTDATGSPFTGVPSG